MINAGDCLGDLLPDLFEQVGEIADCAETTTSQFKCKKFSQTATGAVNGSACITIQDENGLVNPNSLSTEIKMLLFTVDYSPNAIVNQFGGVGGDANNANTASVTTGYTVDVLCNGDIVDTVTDGYFANSCFNCPTGSKIELCINSTAVLSNTDGQGITGNFSASICGASVCVQDIENASVPGLYLPPLIDSCCIDRSTLHLLIQNIQALREAYSEYGQIPSCTSYDFPDDDDHVLLSGASTTTEFLVVGTIEVCAQNPYNNQSAIIDINPIITCSGGNVACPGKTYNLPGPDMDNGLVQEICRRVPVIACGVCSPGDDIRVGVRTRVDCSEDPSQVVGQPGFINSIEQHYCVYRFERQVNDFGDDINSALGKCITTETTDAITSSIELLELACENQAEINLTVRPIRGVSTGPQTNLIQEALTWPPPTPPPRPVPDPPPIKKWFVVGSVTVCDGNNTSNRNENADSQTSITILCGGVPVYEIEDNWIWNDENGCNTINFGRCVECPIDQDLEIQFDNTVEPLFPQILPPDQFEYNLKAFCF